MWDIKNDILYEDKHIIVCRKRAGIPVQSARIGVLDMENCLRNYLSQKKTENSGYIGIVHRLDQPVEGVLVFAKTPKAAKELNRQISGGQMGKYYLAVTKGNPPALSSILEDWLKKDGRTNMSFVVPKGQNGAKKAKLSYRVCQKTELSDGRVKYLVEIQLDTGRHHQIRVQMANAGMPLLGDRKYNPEEKEEVSLGLCAERLVFVHPVTGKNMEFSVCPEGNAFNGFEI